MIFEKLPEDFNPEVYKSIYNDLKDMNNIELFTHYINHGIYENRIYKLSEMNNSIDNIYNKLPEDFDPEIYKSIYHDLKDMNNIELSTHYINHGIYENRIYKILDEINLNKLSEMNNSIKYDIDNILYNNLLNDFFSDINIYVIKDNDNIKYDNYFIFDNFLNIISNLNKNSDCLIINNKFISLFYLKYFYKNDFYELIEKSNYEIINLSYLISDNELNKLITNKYDIIENYLELDCFYIKKNTINKLINIENNNLNENIKYFFDKNNINVGMLTRPLFSYNIELDNYNNDNISNILFNIYYKVTSIFDKIYCINLKLDIDKKLNMKKYANMLNCKYSNFFYDGILGTNLPDMNNLINMGIYSKDILNEKLPYKVTPKIGAIGLNITQSNIFKEAIEKNYEYIMVLEDDIYFNNNYYLVLDSIFNKYKDIDILYLGYTFYEKIKENILFFQESIYSHNIYIPNKQLLQKVLLGGFYAVILSKKALKIINDRFTPIDNISDVLLSDIIFEIKNDFSDDALYKTNHNLNCLLVENLFKVKVNKISLTEHLNISNNNLFSNKKINYLSKLKKIKFKLKYNYKINIYVSSNINNYYKNILKLILDKFNNHNILNEINDNIDICIYSIMDNLIPNNKFINICLNGEKEDCNENVDIAILTTKKFKYNFNIYFPHLFQSLWERKLNYNITLNNTKEEFCAYMYSYDVPYRVEIFNEISKYKKVTSLGKSCNNVEDTDRNTYNDEITYNDLAVQKYSRFKFVLALENGIEKGYLTEKIINPILANSIPIYAGPNDIFDIINKKRIIYVYDFDNFSELNKYIENIDNNNYLYDNILSEKIFTGKITFDNFKEYLNDKIEKSLGLKSRNICINLNNNTLINYYDKIDINIDNISYNDKNTIKEYLLDFIEKDDIILT